MKQPIRRFLRCAVSMVLCAALLCGTVVPAAPVWASTEGELAEETEQDVPEDVPLESEPVSSEPKATLQEDVPLLLQLQKKGYGPHTETITLQDGDSIANISAWSACAVYLGDLSHPADQNDVTVQVLSHGSSQPVPQGVIKLVPRDKAHADYAIDLNGNPEEASAYFGSTSPDFGFDLLVTSGEQTLRVNVKNEGVQVDSRFTLGEIRKDAQGQYQIEGLDLWLKGNVLRGFSPTMDWIAKNLTLTGELAQYFTIGQATAQGIPVVPSEKLAQLQQGEMLIGHLSWVGKLDGGKRHTAAIYYEHTGCQGSWHKYDGSGWEPVTTEVLRSCDKGSFRLRLYPGNGYIDAGQQEEPLQLTDDVLETDLPGGIKVSLLDDQATVLVEYTLKENDAREKPYELRVQLPGMTQKATLTIQVQLVQEYALAQRMSGNVYWENAAHEPELRTLMEDWALVPLIQGKPAATQQQLEACGITLRDSQEAGALQMLPQQIRYRDKNHQEQTCWAWVILPVVQNDQQRRTMLIQRGEETLNTVDYTLHGMAANGADVVLKADCVESRAVQQLAEKGRQRYIVQTADGQPLVLTEAPQVSGVAAENIHVVWAEGLSGIRVDFNAAQVPGDAVVEMRSGNTVRRLTYHFLPFGSSATYYSLGSDDANRPYQQDIQLTDDLAAVSAGREQKINASRLIEDGSFDLYLWSSQYIGHKNHMNASDLPQQTSFATELVKRVTYTSSDESVLQIGSEITHTTEKDPVFDGNGYSNPDGKCFGVQLIPGGKAGKCDVVVTIELNIPSKNDPFGCDISRTPSVVTVGCTFTLTNAELGPEVHANPDTLSAVLERVGTMPSPTVVLLEGGIYEMDLQLMGKNVILRSEQPNDPAIFTGTPDAKGGYIITADPPTGDFALEGLVVDGGGVRGGIQYRHDSQKPLVKWVIQDCLVQNCTTGIYGENYEFCTLENSTVQNCTTAVEGCMIHQCTLQNNAVAMLQNNCVTKQQGIHANRSKFIDNDTDLTIRTNAIGKPIFTIEMPQNYWDGKSAPTVKVVKENGQTEISRPQLKLYTSPYYTDRDCTMLNVDIATTQMQDENTFLLPLEKSDSTGGMLMRADVFATIQKAGKAVRFPIYNEQQNWAAQWDFSTIERTDIDTNLDVSNSLSAQAQQTVDKLPQSDANKILEEINLSHNGNLPGRATLRVRASQQPMAKQNALYLYWVRSDGVIVPADMMEVRYDAHENCYIFAVDHCSEYVITSGTLDSIIVYPDPTPTPGESPVPTEQPRPTQAPGATTAPDSRPQPTAAPDNSPQPTVAPGGEALAGGTPLPSTKPAQSKLYSAQRVMDAFRAQPGDVTLDTTEASHLSQKAFEMLKQRPDAMLRLKGENHVWQFRGSSIESTTLSDGIFDTAVKVGVEDSLAQRIKAVAGEKPWYALETAFSGRLPGPAELELTIDEAEFAGMECALYWLPDEGDAVRIATVNVSQDGKTILPLEHCSVYFLVAEQRGNTDAVKVETASKPEAVYGGTVQIQPVGLLLILVDLLAAAAVWTVYRRKKQ